MSMNRYRGAARHDRDLLRLVKRGNQTGEAVWQSQWFLLAVVLLMSLTDFSTLFSILDTLTVTSKYLGTLITASAALLLNLMPVLAAEALLRGRGARWMAVPPAIGFAVLFGLQAYLRWNTRDMLVAEGTSVITFQMDGAGTLGDGGLAGGTSGGLTGGTAEISAADTAMCIFLMMLPLCTSMVCFALALLGKTPEQRNTAQRRILQQKRKNLAAEIAGELEMLQAPEQQAEYLRQVEGERRKAALTRLHAEKAMADAIAMEELAMAIGSDGSQLDEIAFTGTYYSKSGGIQLQEGEAG